MSEQGRIDEGDEWPVYTLHPAARQPGVLGPLVDVPDGFTERYRQANDEWWACQKVLREAYQAAVG